MPEFAKWKYVFPISIAAVAVLLVIIGLAVSNRAFERQVVKTSQLHHLTVALGIATTAEEMVHGVWADVQYLAGDSDIVKGTDNLQVKLDLFLEKHSDVLNNVAIADASGELIYQSPKSNDKRNICDSAEFQAVWRSGQPYIGKPRQCAMHDGRQGVRVIAPIFDEGQIKGVIYSCLNLTELWVRSIPAAAQGHRDIYWVVSSEGRLLYHSKAEYVGLSWDQIEHNRRATAANAGQAIDEQIENLARRLRKRVQDGEQGTAEYVNALTGTRELVAFAPIRLKNERYGLAVVTPKSEISGPIEAHTRVILVVIAGMLVLLVVAANIAIGGISSQAQLLAERRSAAQRQQAEDKLRLQSEIMKNMSEGLHLVGFNDLRIIYANPKLENMFGYDSGEMNGKHVSIVNAATEKPSEATAKEIVKILNETGEWHGEIANIKKDGTTFWCYANASVFDHPKYGKVIISVHTDISNRKRAEQAVQESEKKYHAIFEQAADAIVVIDTQSGMLVEFNTKAHENLGYSREEFQKLKISDFEVIESAEEIIEHTMRVTREGSDTFETKHRTKDGRIRDIVVTAKSVSIDGRILCSAIWHDVTEQKKLEEAVRESEGKLLAFMASATDSFAVYDSELKLVSINKAGLSLFPAGSTEESLRGKHMLEISPNIKETGRCDDYLKVLKTGEPVHFDDVVSDSRFGKKHLAISAFKMGASLGIILSDITERKRAEEALRESDELFRLMVETAFDGIDISEYDPKTKKRRLVFCNDRFVEMSGYTREQLMSEEDMRELSVNHASAEEKSYRVNCIVNGTPFTGISSWKRPDGKKNTREWSAIYIKKGEKYQVFGVNRDITERKKLEEAVRESEQTFRLFMETAFDGINICEYDPKTKKRRLIFCNDRYVEMSGYTREQLMSAEDLNDLNMIHASAEDNSYMANCMANGTPFTGMCSWKRPDGKENTYEWSAIYVKEGGRHQIFGVDRDITERKRREEDIRQYQKRLQSLAVDLSLVEDQQRRRLASSLHDNAGQLLSLAKIKLSTFDEGDLSAEGKKSLAEIEELVTQAEQSARSLTFRIYNPALHDLGFEPAVEWLVKNVQESYGLKVELRDDGQHKPMDEPLRIVMFQCLREALINVAKHAKVDRAGVGIVRQGQFVRVSIEDHGVGFDPKNILAGSRGFGLFSIRERITQLGGQVEIKSAPGQGTTVILEGPISTDKPKTTRKSL